MSAFVLTFWLGRSKVKNVPHNVPYVLLGAALLWFGWFGFNVSGGSDSAPEWGSSSSVEISCVHI